MLNENMSASSFDAEELENSFPLDVGRRFRGDAGAVLVNSVLDGMESGVPRKRKMRAGAEARRRASVEALLVNLAAASSNVVDPDRFAAVPFNRNDYVGTDLSDVAMRECRNYLAAEGLIEGTGGFQRWDAFGDGKFGRRTRMRATTRLRGMFDRLGIGAKSFTIPPPQLIRIKAPEVGVSPIPPDDVEGSRRLLELVNQRLATLRLDMSAEASAVLAAKYVEDDGEDSADRDRKRRYAGDRSAVSLYRSFKGRWTSGGRIYGGWWMSVPRALRPYITIDGAEVVELDYAALHPRLLFHREGLPMNFDPYAIPGVHGDAIRDLGKRTFNRLLNRDKPRSTQRKQLRAASGDPALLPTGMTFSTYRAMLCHRLADIDRWFGIGEGVRLQRADSELTLGVLAILEAAAVPVLPVHDSFLVPITHEPLLRASMVDVFLKQHGFSPEIAVKRRPGPPSGHHGDHN